MQKRKGNCVYLKSFVRVMYYYSHWSIESAGIVLDALRFSYAPGQIVHKYILKSYFVAMHVVINGSVCNDSVCTVCQLQIYWTHKSLLFFEALLNFWSNKIFFFPYILLVPVTDMQFHTGFKYHVHFNFVTPVESFQFQDNVQYFFPFFLSSQGLNYCYYWFLFGLPKWHKITITAWREIGSNAKIFHHIFHWFQCKKNLPFLLLLPHRFLDNI